MVLMFLQYLIVHIVILQVFSISSVQAGGAISASTSLPQSPRAFFAYNLGLFYSSMTMINTTTSTHQLVFTEKGSCIDQISIS